MKPAFTLLLITAFSFSRGFAQNKIVITYDANGNRIKREMVCAGCRPEAAAEDTLLTDQPVGTESGIIAGFLSAQKGSFTVYPNPAGNVVYIRLDALSLKAGCRMQLSDVSGRVCYRKPLMAAVTAIPLSRLADGLYFVTLFRGGQKDVVKVVKTTGAGSLYLNARLSAYTRIRVYLR